MSTDDAGKGRTADDIRQDLAQAAEKARESMACGEGYKWGPSTDQMVRRVLGRWHPVPTMSSLKDLRRRRIAREETTSDHG